MEFLFLDSVTQNKKVESLNNSKFEKEKEKEKWGEANEPSTFSCKLQRLFV